MEQKFVEFLCCGDSHVFSKYREFKMCKCGKTGYDAGDGYYCRGIGKPSDLKVSDKNPLPKVYVVSETGVEWDIILKVFHKEEDAIKFRQEVIDKNESLVMPSLNYSFVSITINQYDVE